MKLLDAPAALLGWLGRQGTRAVAASIFLGLAAPPLAALFKPYLGETIFVLLVLAFLRVDAAELRRFITAPGPVVAATLWIMLVVPAVLGAVFFMSGLGERMPGLYFVLILQVAGAPIMSAPALAALMGLDAALSLATLVLCTALTPLTASAFTYAFTGSALTSPLQLGLKLFFFLAGSALAAALIRWVAGKSRIERQKQRLDGLSVVALFVFAVAAMDGIAGHVLAEPALAIGLLLLAFALALGLVGVTALVFLRTGRQRALAIGLLAGNRNIGLMLAATGFAIPDLAWLYFGLAQFPIYLLPQLLKPLARRLAALPSPRARGEVKVAALPLPAPRVTRTALRRPPKRPPTRPKCPARC